MKRVCLYFFIKIIIFAFYATAYLLPANNYLVLLNGPSCVGKSTVASLLTSLIPDSFLVSEELVWQETKKELARLFGLEYNLCSNELNDFFLEMDDTTQKKFSTFCENVGDPIEQEVLFRLIKKASLEHSVVLTDWPIVTKHEFDLWKKELSHISMIHVLLYCSIDQLRERLIARNKSGNKNDYRDWLEPFEQYKKMFILQPEVISSELFIQTLDFEMTQAVFFDLLKYFKSMVQEDDSVHYSLSNKLRTEDFLVKRASVFFDQFMSAYFHDENSYNDKKNVAIYFVTETDLVVNTEIFTFDEVAFSITDFLNNLLLFCV